MAGLSVLIASCGGAPRQPPRSAPRHASVVIPAAASGLRCAPSPPPGSWRTGPRAVSPDGKTLASASEHDLVLFDTGTWKPRATIHRSGTPTLALAFSPDGRWLAVDAGAKGAAVGTLDLYESASGKRVETLHTANAPEDQDPVMAFAPDSSWIAWPRRIADDAPPEVGIQRIGVPHGVTVVRGPSTAAAGDDEVPPTIRRMEASGDGKVLAVAWDTGEVALVAVPSGRRIATVKPDSQVGFAFSSSSRYFAAGTTVIDLRTERKRTLHDAACSGGLGAPLFSHDGARVAIGGSVFVTCTFFSGTGRLDRRFPGTPPPLPAHMEDEGIVMPVVWTPHDHGLLVAAMLGSIPTLWNVQTQTKVPLGDDVASVRDSLIRPDGSVVLLYDSGFPYANLVDDSRLVMVTQPPHDEDDAPQGEAGRSADGEMLALSYEDGPHLVSTRDGRVRSRIAAPDVRVVGFDRHAHFVFTMQDELRVWDVATGALRLKPPSCTGCGCR